MKPPFRMRWTRQKLIEEGDGEANIAYYCLHELHLTPSAFLALPRKERAFIIAAIEIRVEQEKKSRRNLNENSAGAATIKAPAFIPHKKGGEPYWQRSARLLRCMTV